MIEVGDGRCRTEAPRSGPRRAPGGSFRESNPVEMLLGLVRGLGGRRGAVTVEFVFGPFVTCFIPALLVVKMPLAPVMEKITWESTTC